MRLLFGHRELGQYIDQVQVPFRRQAVAILVGLREVVAGVEKDHRHIADRFSHQVHHDHVFRLEAAGDADVFRVGGRDLLVHQGSRGGRFFLPCSLGFLHEAAHEEAGRCAWSRVRLTARRRNAADSRAIETSPGKSSRPSDSIRTTTPICNSCLQQIAIGWCGCAPLPRRPRAVRSRAGAAAQGCGWRWPPRCSSPARPLKISRTMPAATVACDTGSIRMKLPVRRWSVVGVEKQRPRGLHVPPRRCC